VACTHNKSAIALTHEYGNGIPCAVASRGCRRLPIKCPQKHHGQRQRLCTWRELWKLLVPLVVAAVVIEWRLQVRVKVQQLRFVLQAKGMELSDTTSCRWLASE
jgi:hypothetical protein